MVRLDNLKGEAYDTVDGLLDAGQVIIEGFTDTIRKYPMISAALVGMFIWNNRKKLKLK